MVVLFDTGHPGFLKLFAVVALGPAFAVLVVGALLAWVFDAFS